MTMLIHHRYQVAEYESQGNTESHRPWPEAFPWEQSTQLKQRRGEAGGALRCDGLSDVSADKDAHSVSRVLMIAEMPSDCVLWGFLLRCTPM